jgi:hypothetical protein
MRDKLVLQELQEQWVKSTKKEVICEIDTLLPEGDFFVA